ncbi:phage tail assembly chaperone [Pasteurella multocida]|uniref:phage tail assembly chaperone n=1 Tax=Pasteurella multocida TaxID=747 RepID=UPI003B00B2AE
MYSVWEQTGIKPNELNTPESPNELMYLLSYFNDIALSRQFGMITNPISYSDILAWSCLTRTNLTTWEVNVIKQIDMVYLNNQVES